MAKKEKPATTQAEYDKAFEDVKSGKIPPPSFDDMGPLPKPEPKKELDKPVKKMAKGGKITAANYDKEYGKIYRKAVKKMSSGGSTASKRADGIATKGKTKGKIC